jgi:hypothetical protein
MRRLEAALLLAVALLGCHPGRGGVGPTSGGPSLLRQAGFLPGDRLETVDGAAVADSAAGLARLARTPAGIEREAVLDRAGQRRLIHFATAHPGSLQAGPGASVLDLGAGRFRVLVHDPQRFKEAVLAAAGALTYQARREGYRQLPLRVAEVPAGAAAGLVGLQPGDELLRLDGRALFTREALLDGLTAALDRLQPARLEVGRGAERRHLDFHLAGRPAPAPGEPVLRWAAVLAPEPDGVRVARADVASPYREAGLSAGVVVLYAGTQRVRELESASLYGRGTRDAPGRGYQVRRGPYRLGIPPR